MSAQEVAEAVVEWAEAQIKELKAGYAYPGATSGALPDVWVVVQQIRTVPNDEEHFPFAGLQQVWLKEYPLELSIMAEQGEGEEAAKTTHEALEGYAETLIGSALADVTLGSRVQMTSPRIEANLAEPFGERPDGTKGRELVMTFVVAEMIELPV